MTKRATTVASMLPRDVTPVNLEVLRRLKLALVELESKAASLRCPAFLPHQRLGPSDLCLGLSACCRMPLCPGQVHGSCQGHCSATKVDVLFLFLSLSLFPSFSLSLSLPLSFASPPGPAPLVSAWARQAQLKLVPGLGSGSMSGSASGLGSAGCSSCLSLEPGHLASQGHPWEFSELQGQSFIGPLLSLVSPGPVMHGSCQPGSQVGPPQGEKCPNAAWSLGTLPPTATVPCPCAHLC